MFPHFHIVTLFLKHQVKPASFLHVHLGLRSHLMSGNFSENQDLTLK